MTHAQSGPAADTLNPKHFTGAKPHTYQGNLWHLHPAIVKRLGPLQNFVNWKWELNEKRNAWTKVPYQPRDPTKKAATDNKKTWGTYREAVANVVAGKAVGIGFCLFETNICAFDIDDCRDLATGEIDPAALALIRRCGATYVEKTVSGTGLRIIGLGGTKYVNRKQKINGSKVSIESYRNCARYITISGMTLDGVKPDMLDLGNIDALITDVVAELDGVKNEARQDKAQQDLDDEFAASAEAEQAGVSSGTGADTGDAFLPGDLIELIEKGVPPQDDLSAAFHHAVCWLADCGWSAERIKRRVAGKPIVPERFAKRLGQEVARCLRKRTQGPQGAGQGTQQGAQQGAQGPGGVALDDFYAFMPNHSYIFVPTREMWPASSVDARLPKVPIKNKNGAPVLDGEGNPKYSKPSVWLDKHRPVEQMTWAPGDPLIVDGRLIAEGGWFERPGTGTFNLYRPPVVRQGNSANADRWVELAHRLYPDDADHLITYCAHRIQHPAVKVSHGIILSGSPGIGKDTLLEPLRHGVGRWNFREVSPQDIMSPYNDYLRCVVLRISEAHDLGDVSRYAFYDRMKTILATPPDVIRVNGKYIPQHHVVNVAGVLYTTNHRFDGVYLPADDRRTYVAWSEILKDDFVDGFWPSLWGWYRAGGLEDVVAYLAEYDLSKFDPKAPPRKTDAFWQIVSVGAAPEESELADVLDILGVQERAQDGDGNPCGPVVTTLDKVIGAAQGGLYERLIDRKNRRGVPHRFERCGYAPVRNDAAKDGLWVIGGKRQKVFGRLDASSSERIKAAGELG